MLEFYLEVFLVHICLVVCCDSVVGCFNDWVTKDDKAIIAILSV